MISGLEGWRQSGAGPGTGVGSAAALRWGGQGVICNVCSCSTWGYRLRYKTLGSSSLCLALGSRVAFLYINHTEDKAAAATAEVAGAATVARTEL